MKFFILLLAICHGASAFAKVEILPYRNHSWSNSWNEAISSELDKKEDSVMMMEKLDESDLKELSCPGFNSVTDNELKKDFWVVFFSSLVRAESAFNMKARSHANVGLLQLAKATARSRCDLSSLDEILDENEHLRCGVKLMTWQLEGAPVSSGKLLRPDLKGQLFGKHILLWGHFVRMIKVAESFWLAGLKSIWSSCHFVVEIFDQLS